MLSRGEELSQGSRQKGVPSAALPCFTGPRKTSERFGLNRHLAASYVGTGRRCIIVDTAPLHNANYRVAGLKWTRGQVNR